MAGFTGLTGGTTGAGGTTGVSTAAGGTGTKGTVIIRGTVDGPGVAGVGKCTAGTRVGVDGVNEVHVVLLDGALGNASRVLSGVRRARVWVTVVVVLSSKRLTSPSSLLGSRSWGNSTG